MKQEINTVKQDKLFEILAKITDKKEMSQFCMDLMTDKELESLSGRWLAANYLHQGLTQREVVKKTGVSIATVTRINKWLKGNIGGYELAMKKLDLV